VAVPKATLRRAAAATPLTVLASRLGITIDVMDLACQRLNCKLEFYIASADPHYWESQEKALCAVGAWQQPGTSHWADIAAGVSASSALCISGGGTTYYATYQIVFTTNLHIK
jgi:hypothetical protein